MQCTFTPAISTIRTWLPMLLLLQFLLWHTLDRITVQYVENFQYAMLYFWDVCEPLMPRKISKRLENIKEWSCIKTSSLLLWLSCQITKLDEGYTANNMILTRLVFAWSRNSSVVYWWISFVMPIKCNFTTCRFFSV